MDWPIDVPMKTVRKDRDTLVREAQEYKVKKWDVKEHPMTGAPPMVDPIRLLDIPFSLGRHLDVALEISPVLFYHEHPELVPRYHPGLDPHVFRDITNGVCGGFTILSWLEHTVRYNYLGWEGSNPYVGREMLDTVELAIDSQINSIQGPLSETVYTSASQRLKHFRKSGTFDNAYQQKGIVFDAHRLLHIGGQLFNGYFTCDRFSNWLFYRQFIVCLDFPSGPTAIPGTFLLAVLDKIEGYYSMECFLSATAGSVDKAGTEFGQLTRTIYQLLDRAYAVAGNNAIDLYKGLETLALGAVLALDSDGISDREFLLRSLEGLIEKTPSLRSIILEITVTFTSYISKHGDTGVHHVLEQYGQEKLHYFPIVESHRGLAKMYRIGTGYRPVDPTVVNQILGLFKLMYIREYKSQEGCLPLTYNIPELDPKIREILKTGDMPSFAECLKLPLSAWNEIHFRPHQIFDYVENELGLLDDKGIAPPTSKINQGYHPDALEALGERIERDPVTTRLVLDMLSKENIPIREYFEECAAAGEIPYEWRVIKLKLKERELKLIARAFSILHPNTRHMASVAEKNIKERILPYFDQQSMTQTGVELKQTLASIVEHLGPKNSTWVGIILDLFQWNYTFRPELQVPFACCLDEIFGGSHFVILQNLFKDAILVSADRYCPPGLTDKFAGWTGHAGGNQGIFQKFWTLITLVAIKKVLLDHGLEHRMTGAGDNQVIVVNTKGKTNPTRVISALKQRLSNVFTSIGLELKPEETWFSSKLFNYQRRYHYLGSPVSNGLKQVVRAFAEGSEGSMGLNSVISTSMNTGVAIAASVCDPLTGPLIAYVEAYTHLSQDSRWITLRRLSKHEKALLSVLCTELGYLPFIQLHGFYYSGHADHATDSIAMMKILWDLDPYFRRGIASALQYVPRVYDSEVALSLVLDPLGIPANLGPSPEGFLRGEVENYLKHHTTLKNRRLKSVFKYLDAAKRRELAKAIMTIEPKDLSLNHQIMENHIIGQCYSVLNHFTRLGSLARQVQFDKKHKHEWYTETGDQGSFIHRIEVLSRLKATAIVNQLQNIKRVESTMIKSVLGRMYDSSSSTKRPSFLSFCEAHSLHDDCSLSLRLYLTSYVAGLLPERLYGPFVASPFEQVKFLFDPSRLKQGDALSVMVLTPASSTFASRHLEQGPMERYLGGSTADSVKTTPLVNIKGLTERTNIRNLLTLHSWVLAQGHSPELGRVFVDLLRSRVPNICDELLAAQPEKSGGSYRHRARSSIEDKGSYLNSQDCTSSYIKISSNYLTKFNEGHKDWNIFFQRIYNYGYYCLSMKSPSDKQLVCVIRTDCCTSVVDDPQFHVDENLFPESLRAPPGYALTLDAELKVKEELHHMRTFDLTRLPHGYEPCDVVASYIAHSLMKQLHAHDTGLRLSGSEHQIRSRFSVQYNISHFRIAPMNMIIASIGGAMVLNNFQNCFQTRRILVEKLKAWLSLPVIPIDAGPFTKFLAALVEAGKVQELLALSGCFTGYLNERYTRQLMRPLVAAIVQVLEGHSHVPARPVVLIEYRTSRNNLRYAVRAITRDSRRALKTWRESPMMHPRQLLEMAPDPDGWMMPLLTPDVESTLALARSIHASSDVLLFEGAPSTTTRIPEIGDLIGRSWFVSSGRESCVADIPRDLRIWERQMHRMAKCGSETPSAKYKLLEIMVHKEWVSADIHVIACLAEGGGSYAALLLHLYPDAHLIFNTLLLPDKVSKEQIGHHLPIPLQCQHINAVNITDCGLNSQEFGDLTKKSTWQDIARAVHATDYDIGILTMDMEYREKDSPTVLQELCTFLAVEKPLRVVIRLFTSMPYKLQSKTIGILKSLYQDVELFKPSFSNYTSSEYFALCESPVEIPVSPQPACVSQIIQTINERRSNYNYKDHLSHIFTQLSWRTRLNLCGTTDLYSVMFDEEGLNLLQRESGTVLRVLVDVMMVRSETGIKMEKSVQHMLLGRTHGGKLFWEGIIAVLITLIGVLHPNFEAARKKVHGNDLEQEREAEAWMNYILGLVNTCCLTDKSATKAYNWIGMSLLIPTEPGVHYIAQITGVISIMYRLFPGLFPSLNKNIMDHVSHGLMGHVAVHEWMNQINSKNFLVGDLLALKGAVEFFNRTEPYSLTGFSGSSRLINILAAHWVFPPQDERTLAVVAVENWEDYSQDIRINGRCIRHVITHRRKITPLAPWTISLLGVYALEMDGREIQRFIYRLGNEKVLSSPGRLGFAD